MVRILESRASTPTLLSAATIRRVHATLMSALNTAAKRRLIAFNPAAFVELESGRRPKAVVWTDARVALWRATGERPKVAVWTPTQTGAFLDHVRDDRLYPLFHLVVFRGLRRGEAVGLRWTDVDLDALTVTVSEQVVQLGWQTERGAPKTDSGARTIALDADTAAVLRDHRQRQELERTAWGQGWMPTGLVFTREDGSELHPATVTTRFERLVRGADLPPVRLHDLRHGAATLALAGGTHLKVVSEMLGHSSIGITADTTVGAAAAVGYARRWLTSDWQPHWTSGAFGLLLMAAAVPAFLHFAHRVESEAATRGLPALTFVLVVAAQLGLLDEGGGRRRRR